MPGCEKAESVLSALKKAYPNAKYYLTFKTPLQLLVAAILSAQVPDERVNAATPTLFKRFKTVKDFAKASRSDLLNFIGKITFAGNKSKNIIAACKILADKHKGRVPKTVEELTALPGVGRKTAIVILSNAFEIVDGVVVDTHVIRVAFRLGWTKNTNPDKIEEDLDDLIPKSWWKQTQWLLKAHGRAVCTAKAPACKSCPVLRFCPRVGVEEKK